MDYIVKQLNKNYLKKNIKDFIEILKNEPYEYWQKENFFRYLPGKFEYSHYLELNKELIAYIISSLKNDSIAYIHKFMTKKEFRRQGYGKILYEVFQNYCVKKNIHSIQLSVIENNIKAINFYKNIGFSVINERIDRINHIRLFIMERHL